MSVIDIPLQRAIAGCPSTVRLNVDKNHAWKSAHAEVRSGNWTLLGAKPTSYLRWIGTARFADGSTGFIPDGARLAELSTVFQANPLQSGLSVPMLVADQQTVQFLRGRHRAFWLASRSAPFLPLLVPTSQAPHFMELLDATAL